MIFTLYVINKAGGLIFQQDFHSLKRLSANDQLRLGSTFHSLHAISALLTTPSSSSSGGMVAMETDSFRLECLQANTGTKFFLTADPLHASHELKEALRAVYELYVDFVLKNPFYELEMPIRCALFLNKLQPLVDKYALDHHSRRKPQPFD